MNEAGEVFLRQHGWWVKEGWYHLWIIVGHVEQSSWPSVCWSGEPILACSSTGSLPGRLQFPVFTLTVERSHGSIG